MKTCFYCDEEVTTAQEKTMYPIERPYVNLWFHRSCYKLVENNMCLYLQSNENKLIAFVEDFSSKTSKNR